MALLLFAVGLELSLSHVRQWARSVFVGGGLQVGTTLVCVAALALVVGNPADPGAVLRRAGGHVVDRDRDQGIC